MVEFKKKIATAYIKLPKITKNTILNLNIDKIIKIIKETEENEELNSQYLSLIEIK